MRLQSIWILSVFSLLVSCNNGSRCYESTDTLMVTSFSGNNSKKIGPLLVKGYGRNLKGDTIYYSTDSALTKKAGLPLSVLADSTGFTVTANGKSSVFWIRHTLNLQLVSQSCGFAPNFVLTATKHSTLIDSLRVTNPNIGPKSLESYSANGQNISVYLHLTAH